MGQLASQPGGGAWGVDTQQAPQEEARMGWLLTFAGLPSAPWTVCTALPGPHVPGPGGHCSLLLGPSQGAC